MLLKLSALEADGSAIVSCGTRSCSRPSVPSVRRNRKPCPAGSRAQGWGDGLSPDPSYSV
jgi:hypothetical protein